MERWQREQLGGTWRGAGVGVGGGGGGGGIGGWRDGWMVGRLVVDGMRWRGFE